MVLNRDVHGNGECGIPIFSVEFPWEWEPYCLNLWELDGNGNCLDGNGNA